MTTTIRCRCRASKCYPTFTPIGPALVLLDADELKRLGDLHLRTWVNGELRQDATVDDDMIYCPREALQALSRFQPLEPGRCHSGCRSTAGRHEECEAERRAALPEWASTAPTPAIGDRPPISRLSSLKLGRPPRTHRRPGAGRRSDRRSGTRACGELVLRDQLFGSGMLQIPRPCVAA
ncbi:hypothetical protein GCM10009798_05020 [Nocardioides panacihumi]|uniref:Fumarylacetoacetase-like C-terminal domain-containing protein n=1 Tax=Nocardioides panacihumi TaxID=400774 RepID=A0ABN2QBR4_9ACTN